MAIDHILIRKINQQDIPAIAAIHKEAYPSDHFSSKYNLRMLQAYYSEICRGGKFSLVVTDAVDCVIGYLIADYIKNIKKAKSIFLGKKFFPIAFLLLKYSNFLSILLKEKVKNLFSGENFKSKAEMRLISLAVSPEHQNRSLGSLLLGAFENQLKIHNINSYGLSVRKSNEKAIRFYRKHGFVEESSGPQLISLIKIISEET